LGGSDVVARAPFFFTGDAVEVLLDDLFPSRQSVASAHSINYVRSGRTKAAGTRRAPPAPGFVDECDDSWVLKNSSFSKTAEIWGIEYV